VPARLGRGVRLAAAGLADAFAADGLRFHVIVLSRNGAGFRLILCEMAWKNRGFFAAGLADRR
jgi:hypothetical protein